MLGGIVIAILLVVLPMNWIVMLFCWAVLDICIGWLIIILTDHKLLRIGLLIVSIILISIRGFYQVQDQYFKDHQQIEKKIKQPSQPPVAQKQPTPQKKVLKNGTVDSGKEKRADIMVNNSPGSIVTKNQQGNNTVINELPEPKLNFQIISSNVPQGNLFKTEYHLSIESKVPLRRLYLTAKAPSAVDFKIKSDDGSMFNLWEGKQDGMPFVALTNAWGGYTLQVFSEKPEHFEIIPRVE